MLIVNCIFAQDIPTFQGERVVVTGSRLPEPVLEAPADISVFTADDIRALGVKSLADLLDLAPGVQVKKTGTWGNLSTIRVRGSNPEQVLFLLDGKRINSPLLGQVDLGDWLLTNVDKIEIVRGPASSLYGADAAFGVVNIITKKDSKGYNLSGELGGYGRQFFSGSGNREWGGAKIRAGMDYLKSDGFRVNNAYAAQNYYGNVGGELGSGMWDVSAVLFKADKGIPGSLIFPLTTAKQNDTNANVAVSWHDNDTLGIKADLYQTIGEQDFNFVPGVTAADHYKSWTTVGNVSRSFQFNRTNILDTGIEYRGDKSASTKSGDHSVGNTAVWLQERSRWNNFLFNLGARCDSHSVFGTVVDPRVGVLYELQKDTTLRATLSQAFRAPTLNELYWYEADPVWGTITQGNALLKPERSQMVDVGIRKDFGEGSLLALSGYSSRVDNLIKWVDISGTWSNWQTRNIAAADFSGAETELVARFGLLKTFINYTFQRAKDAGSSKDLVYSPKDRGNVGITYADPGGNRAGFTTRWVGYQYTKEDNSATLNPYTVTDISLGKKIGGVEISAKAENLFNESYQETADYPMPGQVFMVGVKYGW